MKKLLSKLSVLLLLGYVGITGVVSGFGSLVVDIAGGITDIGKGAYGIWMGEKTTEGYYLVEEGIKATAGDGVVGTTALVAVSIDPKGAWKGIKNGFQALLQQGVKNMDEVASSIANGHAIKHLPEFAGLGIKNADDLAKHAENIIKNAQGTPNMRQLERGRSMYIDPKTQTVVVIDPNHVDKGTVFVHNPDITNAPNAEIYLSNQK